LFPARHRNKRLCLRAMVRARAGVLDAAQADLDEVLRLSEGGVIERAEWVWVQAHVLNRRQRARDVLGLIEPYLERHHAELKGSEYPVDRAQLYAEAALAYEALARYREALDCERRAAAAREQAAAQAAHARRLTLQIDHELDAAHRARDEARRESDRERSAREQLATLNRELEAANAAKTRFLAAASHDLRQPVQALAMYVAALQRERSPHEQQMLVSRIDASLQSLAQLFDALLDISQLDAGLVPVHRAPVDLAALVERLVDEYRIAAGTRSLGLRWRRPPGPAGVVGTSDAALLERCLRNLLDNALKYTLQGGVVVRLRPAGPELWRIEVRDTGVGIAGELQPQVFDEFFQIGNDERDRSRGLGLGLAIVRRTAALLGHRLGVRSRPGRGSCFWVELPRAEVTAESPAAALPADISAPLGLIVIDDDAQVRDALVSLLRRWGHRVWSGEDADASLAAWRGSGQPPVHGAIVDLRLRGRRTGLQAIADLRQQLDGGLPALVVTGDMAPERLALLAEAAQPWLPKPLMPMRLRSWLQRLPMHAA
jgi:signal transduction histidine kinase/CheY-like chemotaxis protein